MIGVTNYFTSWREWRWIHGANLMAENTYRPERGMQYVGGQEAYRVLDPWFN